MAGSGLWFFFIFVLFLYFECLWSPKRKGVKKRAKVTVKKQKQSGLSLVKSVLLPVLAYLFSILVVAFLYLYYVLATGSWLGPATTFVESRTLLVVTQSGSDPAARHGSGTFPTWQKFHNFFCDSEGSWTRQKNFELSIKKRTNAKPFPIVHE